MKSSLIAFLLLPFLLWSQGQQPPYQGWYKKGNLLIAEQNKQYGLVNRQGKQLIPFKYHDMGFSYSTPLLVVSKNMGNGAYRKGLLDTLGQERAPFEYFHVYDLEQGKVVAQKQNAIDIYGADGKLIRSMPLKSISAVGDGRYIAVKDSLGKDYATLLNADMSLIMPYQYTYFGWVKGDWAFAINHITQKRGLLRISDGHYLPISNDIMGLWKMDGNGFMVMETGHIDSRNYGLLDSNMQQVYPPIYKGACIMPATPQYLFAKEQGGYYALHDTKGNRRSEYDYSKLQKLEITSRMLDANLSSAEMLASPFYSIKNEKTNQLGLLHNTRGWLFGDTCLSFGILAEDRIIVETRDADGFLRSQLFDLDRRPLTPVYSTIQLNLNKYIIAEQDGQNLLLDQNGQLLQTIDTQANPYFFTKNGKEYCILRRKGKRALCDAQFQPLSDFKYLEMSESVREDWRNAAGSKPGYGYWVAIGQAEDGSWELIDEHGKGLKVGN